MSEEFTGLGCDDFDVEVGDEQGLRGCVCGPLGLELCAQVHHQLDHRVTNLCGKGTGPAWVAISQPRCQQSSRFSDRGNQ